MSTLKEKLYEIIERDKDELFEILGDLIKINSENFGSHGNEAECSDYIADYFRNLGYDGESYSPLEVENLKNHPDYLDGRNLENRKCCSVLIPGTKHDRRLMLAAHVDTVEIGDLKNWEFPPLAGDMVDGMIRGRGACDDKYGCAICMFLIKKLKELGVALDFDLVFAGYSDEEYGGSNGALASCLKYPSDDCLNIDCREHELWDSGVGGGCIKFLVSSKESVDNCTRVINGLNLFIDRLAEFENRRKAELEAEPSFAGDMVAARPMRIMHFTTGDAGGTDMDKGEFLVTLYTTQNEKTIRSELDAVLDSLKADFDKMGLNEPSYVFTTRFFHYIESHGDTPVTDKIIRLGEENGYHIKRCGACLSDLPMFRIYGSSRAVALGAGGAFSRKGGSHQANEYIECDKLLKLAKVIAGFVAEY